MKKTRVCLGFLLGLIGLFGIANGVYGLACNDSPTRLLSKIFNYFKDGSYYIYPAEKGIYEFFSLAWVTGGLLIFYIGVFRVTTITEIRKTYRKICRLIRHLFRPSCPECQSKDSVIPIFYGKPINPEKDKENVRMNKYLRDGCTVCDERWFCWECKSKFI